jgi:probable rRNA maturation factor
MFIHGTLHILGYDHENESEANNMELKEIELLSKFNIINPYKI